MKTHRRRYHAPDRRPVIGEQVKLVWDGCSICGDPHIVGIGQYHSLDGKKPVAFTSTDWELDVVPYDYKE